MFNKINYQLRHKLVFLQIYNGMVMLFGLGLPVYQYSLCRLFAVFNIL